MYPSDNQKNFIKKIKKNKRKVLFWQVAIILSFIICWELLTYFGILNSFIYSSPSKIFPYFFFNVFFISVRYLSSTTLSIGISYNLSQLITI